LTSCHAASSSAPLYPIAASLGSASSRFMPPNCFARALTSSREMVRAPPLEAETAPAARSSLSRTDACESLRSTPLSTASVCGGDRIQAGPEIWSHTASSSLPV